MNLQQRALARKYAQAYMKLFGAQLTPQTVAQLSALITEYAADKSRFFYLDLSSFPAQFKTDLFLKVCDQFALRDTLSRLAVVLAQQGRLGLVMQVIQAIIALYQEEQNLVQVVMTSAHPLSADERAVVQKFLQQTTGKKIQIQDKIDPNLIAGIRLQSDTFLFEHSVAKQLRALAAYAGNIGLLCAGNYKR